MVRRVRDATGDSVEAIAAQLGLPRATFYRWEERARDGRLEDRLVVPHHTVPAPTPAEVAAVREYALAHPLIGYKRMCWQMVDADVVYLLPYQVYEILRAADLIRRREMVIADPLHRPAAPDHSDQVWHVDLMYLYIRPRWYYLVDILDGYSRFLVHWSLNFTMTADTVTLTAQEAVERLDVRRPGEPHIVHDNGSQFLGKDWRDFVTGSGITDIRTRIAHPESNGRLERLHRTHRAEGLIQEEIDDYYQALDAMAGWVQYYNYQRPHSALQYLRPADYYRGDPAACLAARARKLAQATQDRGAYWGNITRRAGNSEGGVVE